MSLRLLVCNLTLTVLISACTASPRFTSGRYDPSGNYRVGQTWICTASFYAEDFDGRKTASGETYDMHGSTAAHNSLPFGTQLRVEYPPTGKTTTVVVNDRGPHIAGRSLDLSLGAARQIGLTGPGVGEVRVTILSLPDNP